MTFLAPLYLLIAAAAAVPLLLHLLRKNISARVDFPAARYLQRAEREHSRSMRLRNLLMLLLRVLLVLAIAFAAARPFVPGLGVGHGATAVAVVLDNSLSTSAMSGGAPVFDQLRDATRRLLLAATPADRLWLATADGRLRTGSRESLLGELARTAPFEGAGDLPLALRRATAAVRNAGLPASVVAVGTDGQRSAWSTVTRVAGPVSLFVPSGSPPPNRSVVAATVEPARWTPRGAVIARVEASDSVGYRIVLGARTLARGVAGRGEPLSLRLSPPERGWQAGAVELEPDDFTADDRRHFAVWIGAAPAVASASSAGPFAATAMSALVADGRAAVGGDIRIAAADDAGQLPALLLPPADPVRLGAANRELARLGVPWQYGAVDRSPALARGEWMDGVSVTERYRLVADGTASADTLATAGGEAWMVAGPGYVLVASRLDPASTNLPLRAAFVPWLADLLGQRLGGPAGEVGAPLHAAPGAVLTLPPGIDALESAAGARRAVSGEQATAPAERGVWFMLKGGRPVGAVVVEAPPEESALARWSAAQLAPRLAVRAARAATTADAWMHDTWAAGTSRPVATPLLLIALLLLAAETVAARASRSAA